MNPSPSSSSAAGILIFPKRIVPYLVGPSSNQDEIATVDEGQLVIRKMVHVRPHLGLARLHDLLLDNVLDF